MEKEIKWNYEIGDKLKNNYHDETIIDRELRVIIDSKNHTIRKKYYKIKCNKCKYTFWKREHEIEKTYCPCCINKIVVKGINDVATTRPDLIKYFVDIEDSYKYTYGSEKKVLFKCPICGSIRLLSINFVSSRGFVCDKCGDGISYPEKFFIGLLEQLHIKYIRQFSKKDASWVGNYFYDFYLIDYNYIIEVNGMQHYKPSFNYNNIDYEKQKQIDLNKKQLANEHNIIKYVYIDARYSDIEWIKESITKSDLKYILNFENVDWSKCNEYACNSLVKEVCDYWKEYYKEGITTKTLMENFKLDRTTISTYLKRGNVNGWCYYNSKEELLKNLHNNAPKLNMDIVKSACDDWNDGYSVKELSEKYLVTTKTINSYLKLGVDNNWCDYTVKESKIRTSKTNIELLSKKVNMYKDNKFILQSINARQLSEDSYDLIGIKLCRSNIAAVCKRERKQHHGFIFRYDEDDELETN